MITVWQKAGMYDRRQASVSTWMFRIARNRRIDAQRRQRRPELTADDPMLRPPELEQPDDLLARDQLEGIVRAELVKLPQDQLLLLQAAFYDGLSHSEIARAYRPGHADYTYDAKYGVRDYRGGGRSSARETAARVAAGAIARKVIPGVAIRAAVVQIGPHAIDRSRFDWDQRTENPFWAPDAGIVPVWEAHLEQVRKAGSSTGAVIEVEATGVPPGWGAPLYGKLDAELAAALMSINAAKGVEIGDGFASAALSGEENADEMRMGPEGPVFLSNHAGGILGGISSGQPVTARVAFKPTSSILTLRRSVNADGEEIDLRTKGRHDPCVGIRAVPVVEAMTACVLADAFLRQRGQVG
jgi:chorismate synthase